jgi:FkbM family methyltransferase
VVALTRQVVGNVAQGFALWRSLAGTVGPLGAAKYAACRRLMSELRLRPVGVVHPLAIRTRSSDLQVVRQVFTEREYAPLAGLPDIDLVMDCGANIGCSSSWFLSNFPGCTVLAVEPDPGNFALLARNLQPYGSRARALRAGVWSAPCGLRMSRERYRDGREWARQVAPCAPGEAPEFPGLDIPALLALAGRERVSVLKVDIEGAEAVLFGEGAARWMDQVDSIAIELHDDSSFGSGSAAFHAAIDGRGFTTERCGELVLCRRR